MLLLLVVFGITSVAPAFGQVQPEVGIQIGSGSSENISCVSATNCFSPNPLTVSPGTTVTWKNLDSVGHTITSVNNLCNGPHMTIQVATDIKSVDPTVLVRTSLTGITYAKLAQDQPYAADNVNASIRRLVYEAYVSPTAKSLEVVVMEEIGHNTFSVQKTVQVSGCDVGSIFDSGIISPGKTFEFMFSTSGEYNYFCTIHPWMMGQVFVGNDVSGQPSDTQSSAIQMPPVTTPSVIPEFPLAIPIMLIGIVSVIAFYKIRIN